MLDIQLPFDIEERLDAVARRSGLSKSDVARDAILEHLESIEDILKAEEALRSIRAGSSPTFTLEEVERELGLDR